MPALSRLLRFAVGFLGLMAIFIVIGVTLTILGEVLL